MVMSAGRFRTILVVPAPTFTDCRPLDGDTGFARAPFTEMVPLVTQLGIRTWYVNALSALIVVVSESLKGYNVLTLAVILFPADCQKLPDTGKSYHEGVPFANVVWVEKGPR